MTNEFAREARYTVLKSADVMQCLAVSELIELRRIQAKVEEHRAEIGKPPLDCVVVESDWPEYEPTWRAIEARVVGSPEESTAQTAESDALRARIAAMEQQEPVMWVNSSHINSSRINKERGGRGDQHTCSETKTAYHDTPLYALDGAKGE